MKNVMMNSTKLLIASVMMTMAAQPAHAFLGFGKQQQQPAPADAGVSIQAMNLNESSDKAQAAQQVLQQMSVQMTSAITAIEAKLNAGQTSDALNSAKALLDDVRVKTGIDPKARLRENFYVATVFPANAKNMSNLSDEQKDIVVRAVRDFRGGLYLDILNLSKRVSLLYIRAFHAEIKKSGGLTIEDRQKIVKDLATAAVVPMPIVDKQGKKIVAFDEDVANEDHTYMFNRDIKMYLLNAKDLQVTEVAWMNYLAQYKASLGGVPYQAPQVQAQQPQLSPSQLCVNYLYDRAYFKPNNEQMSGLLKECITHKNLVTARSCMDDYLKKTSGLVEVDDLFDAINFCSAAN